jgi:PEP-CTERM motif
MKKTIQYALAAGTAALGLFAVGAGPAHAHFIVDLSCTESGCPGAIDMHLDKAKDTNSFSGDVLGTGDIGITSFGFVDVSNGDATVKPIKDGSLIQLILTPVDPTLFDSFDFRGQPLKDGSTVVVDVQDNQGDPVQEFKFTGLSADADFGAIGIIGTLGETIKWVEVSDSLGFKELKHFEWDTASSSVPEPSTWAMMALGFAGLGFAGYRKAKRAAFAAA